MERPSWASRCLWAGLAVAWFNLIYHTTNRLAAGSGPHPQLQAGWELGIPRVDWLILPYWSIDVLFVVAFLACRTVLDLRVLAGRTMLAALLAGVVFAIWPLDLGFVRTPGEGPWAWAFRALYAFDQPHNLFPSLHVAFVVILRVAYRRILDGLAAWAMQVWLTIITLSTVLVHQHHLADVAGGALLGLLCCYLVDGRSLPAGRVRPGRSGWQLAVVHAVAAALCVAGAVVGDGWWLVLLWPGLALALVAAGHAGLGAAVLAPRAAGPSWAARLILLPWLEAVGWSRRWWWRRAEPPTHIAAGVYVGRIAEAAAWTGEIIDCTSEHRRRGAAGRHQRQPLWDLGLPDAQALAAAADAVEAARSRGPVLVCCALGRGRSALVAAAWLRRTGRAADGRSAVAQVRAARPWISPVPGAEVVLDGGSACA
jgi:protein-tyrosine phosphatase/membrane-associated phospholipid phosphatase